MQRLEQSSKVLYSYIDEEGCRSFTDLYGKLTFAGGAGSRASLFGFSFNDDVSYQALSNLDWSNVAAVFIVVPRAARCSSRATSPAPATASIS